MPQVAQICCKMNLEIYDALTVPSKGFCTMRIGYARVSTDDQTLDLQRDALKRAKCRHTYEEHASGKNTARPELEGCLLLDQLGIDSTAVLGYSQGGAIAQQLVLDYPKRCNRLVLACTYAFNMATFREKLEGHFVPLLVHILGMRRFAKLVFSQGLTQIGKERAD
jgi:pimeloyl-ACP methyl ester carboxylesterase